MADPTPSDLTEAVAAFWENLPSPIDMDMQDDGAARECVEAILAAAAMRAAAPTPSNPTEAPPYTARNYEVVAVLERCLDVCGGEYDPTHLAEEIEALLTRLKEQSQ